MTIALGILADDGIVLCADSQYTSETKSHGPKIIPWFGRRAAVLFALAGDVPNALAIIQQCKEVLSSTKRNQSISNILKVIRAVVRYGHEAYVDRRPLPDRESARFELIIAIATGGAQPRLFYTSSAAVVEFTERPYEVLGSGRAIAEFMLETGYRTNGISVNQAVFLAIRAVAAAKMLDAFSGGPVHFTTIRNGVVSALVPFDVKEADHRTF